jgi:putative phosphoribosyl transferase
MGRPPYADRDEAGRALAGLLSAYAGHDHAVVLGLPRGGVPVAAQVSAALHLPLDVLVVRKLGLPGHAELAMGAIAGVGGAIELVRNYRVVAEGHVPDEVFADVYRRELAALRERELRYREGRAAVPIRGRVVILVDDGLATGATMRAAVAAVRRQEPERIVIGVPVGAQATCENLRAQADDVVCAWTPEPFAAVGQAYLDFGPTSDEAVHRALAGS